ncbi:MAG: thioredoxin domain-containing protein [Pseudomonadota bacterium]
MTLKDTQTSSYLLSHQDDPVNWHPWGEEAIAQAKKKNRPILLSIGDSASHDCKVMASEAFTSNQIAKLMNNQFVNILVDRNERRDVDRVYQTAHRLLTRSGGGWPLTVFLDPNDLLPFYSGTYFPAQANEKAPAFRDVLKRMSDTYETQFEKISEFKPKLLEAIVKAVGGGESSEVGERLVDRACAQIDNSFDEKYGGFESTPKYPHAPGLAFLNGAIEHAGNEEQATRATHMLDFTLAQLSLGGMHDHIGGGLFGYSAERDWSIPHFEKTLADNAQLISVFAERAQETNVPWFKHVANQAADWMLREMLLTNGAFATSLDARSNNTEGRYYTWSKDEVKAVLTDDASEFSFAFGLDKSANFRGKWHLACKMPETLSELPGEESIETYKGYFQKLLDARHSRHAPYRDETVVAAWNALAIKALFDLARSADREDCSTAGFATIDYLRDVHWRNSTLAATSKDGKPGVAGYLEDYAFLLDALVSLDTDKRRSEDLEFATDLADSMVSRFYDDNNGGFFFVQREDAAPLHALKIFADDWIPSGNAIALSGLISLSRITDDNQHAEIIERSLKAGMGDTNDWPSAHASMVRASMRFENFRQ